ncbi:MAG TPA: hypothetical protein VGN69_10205, partial [Solirubrobacteraceae bacterium]|nr:hypothetical protein [Solirubrobacteraceae bacterium]
FFAMPYAIVLAWVLTRDGGAQRTRGGLVLLALMLAVEAFAYPLALPLPVLALAVFAWQDRRARRQAGQPVAPIRLGGLYRGRRSLLWLVPLAAVLAVPLRGVIEKAGAGAIVVLDFTHSLGTWAGDVPGYFPEHEFLSLSSTPILLVVSPLLLLAIGLALRHAPRSVRWGLGSLLVFGVAAVVLFRLRRFGYYFHFKILAFLGPLAVVMIAVGLSRIRRVGIALLVLYALNAQAGATDELTNTHNQLSDLIVQLRPANAKLPPGSSIRLDMNPGLQIWTAYMLAPHRLCSQRPVLNTSYPHVPISRKADFILANHGMRQPFDAQGGPIAYLGQFRLYREKPDVPGPDRCSQRMVQTVNDIAAS